MIRDTLPTDGLRKMGPHDRLVVRPIRAAEYVAHMVDKALGHVLVEPDPLDEWRRRWEDVLADPEDSGGKDSEPYQLAQVMQRLAEEWADDDREDMRQRFVAFCRWVYTEALDQELFGEYLFAAPDTLEPLWYAFDAGCTAIARRERGCV